VVRAGARLASDPAVRVVDTRPSAWPMPGHEILSAGELVRTLLAKAKAEAALRRVPLP
jgi:hypothetical protein